MKIALIGTGKTGSWVENLGKNHIVATFNSKKQVTVEALQEVDVIVVFVPGSAVPSIIPTILASKKNTVWGSTGVVWPENIDVDLKKQGITWITGSNFSLGMNLVYQAIEVLSRAKNILPNANFTIHEIHHTQKKDAPSGTALSWEKTLKQPCSITHERTGDVKGIHTLTLSTDKEKITLQHETLDRSLFAEGALWTAKQLHARTFCKAGLHEFKEVVQILLQGQLTHDKSQNMQNLYSSNHPL